MGLRYIKVNGMMLQQLIQDYSTSEIMGGRYINSDRMKVHLRKQENDTSLNTGFSYIALRYITDVKWGVYGPCVVAPRYDVSYYPIPTTSSI